MRAALPNTAPLFMLSTVLVAMLFFGASTDTRCKREVLLASALMDRFTPGTMAPPRKEVSGPMTEMVVAVPMSRMIRGAPYSAMAPTAPATRSAPISEGSSSRMLSPVLMPAPTTMGVNPISRFMAVFMEMVTGGTTEDRMAPSKPR